MLAIYAGHSDVASQLAITAQINAVNAQQQTASLLALLYGLPLVGDRLLVRGENPAILDNSGFSYSYHLVSHGDYFRFMAWLETKRLDPHALYHGASLVSVAAQFGQFAIVAELLKLGVVFKNNDPKLSLAYYVVMHDKLMFLKAYSPKEKTTLVTLTELAAVHGSILCLEWLLGQIPVEATKEIALYEAIISSGNLAAVKLITRFCCDTNRILNQDQETAILIAARLGFESIVELLIEFGADPTRKNKLGQTAYHIAILQHDKDLLTRLFELTPPADWPNDLLDNQQYPALEEVQAVLMQYRSKMGLAAEKPKTTVKPAEPELKMPAKDALDQLTQFLQDAEFEEAALLLAQNKLLLNVFKTEQGGKLVQLIFKQVYEPSSWWPLSQSAPHDSLLSLLKQENIDLRLYKGSHNVLCEIIAADNSDVAVYRLSVLESYFPEVLPALIADRHTPQYNFMQTALNRHLIQEFLKMDSLIKADAKNNSTQLFSLHEAVRAENDIAILAMIERYPINQRNNEQQTALMLAAKQGNTRLTKLLITHGANYNLVDIYGATLLHYAISSGKEDTALFILPLLMNKNRANRHGITPLMLAAHKGMSSIVRYLCQDADYTTDVDHYGLSAMHWAARAGQAKCIATLAQHGYPIDGATLPAKDQKLRNVEQTSLQIAASQGHKDEVSSLLTFGASPNKVDADGFGLCEHAVMGKNSEVQRITTEWKECANPSHQATLLHALCQTDNVSKLAELLLTRTLMDKENAREQNALHICALYGSANSARILLENAVLPLSALNQPDKTGLTPLMLAAYQGNVALIELFAQYNANLNLKVTHNGRSALHFAVMQEHLGAVVSLLMHEADFQLTNTEGLTALQVALLQGSIPIACRLAFAGDRSYQKNSILALPQTIQTKINSILPEFNQAFLELKDSGAVHRTQAKKQAVVGPAIPRSTTLSEKDNVSEPYSPPLFKPQFTAGTRISIQDSADLVTSEKLVLSAIDFDESLKQSLATIKQFHPALLSQWQSFCTALIKTPSHDFKKSEKQVLLGAAFACFKQDMQDYEPAQWLTISAHLKSIYGETILYQLFNHVRQEKGSVTNKAVTFRNYLTVMQLLLDLHQEPGINLLVNKLMPDLLSLITQLQDVQAEMFAKRYPARDIDVVLNEFLTPDELVQFPITADEAAKLKGRYQSVLEHLKTSRIVPLDELTLHAKKYALIYQQSQDPEALDKLLAITIETLRRVNKLNLYDTQILSILLFLEKPNDLRGRAAQIGPGQGKSAIIAVKSALHALLGKKVDIITSSSYLAQFGEMTFKPFYETLGLISSSISHSPQTRDDFNADILYGVITDYQFPYLREGLYQSMLRYYERDEVWVKRPFDLVLIDEFDNVVLDLASHSARMAVPATEDIAWIYEPMLQFAKQHPETATVRQLLDYFHNNVDKKYHDDLKTIDKKRLLRWYESAKIALFDKKEGRDYVIQKVARVVTGKKLEQDTIVIVDFSITGRPAEASEWQNGLHQFLQAKHGLVISPESLMAASISPIQYLNQYQTIFGLTGTLGDSSEREELLNVLHIDTRDVPPRFKSRLIHHELSLTETSAEQYQMVAEQLRSMQTQGRPVLVLLETINDARKLEDYLKTNGFQNYQVLDTQQKENENYLVARAGESGMITISTNAGGRGTDIILSPASLAAGGLHTLFLFYPKNTRVQTQGENRAARQGQPGSCGMILSIADQSPLLSSFVDSTRNITLVHLEAMRRKITEMESSNRRVRFKVELSIFNQLKQFFTLNNALHSSLKSQLVKNHLMNNCQLFTTTKPEQLVKHFCDAYLESTLQIWTQCYSALHHEIETSNPELILEVIKGVFAKYDKQLTWYLIESGVNALRAWENIASNPLVFDDKQPMIEHIKQTALEMMALPQLTKTWDFAAAAQQSLTYTSDNAAQHVAFIASRNNADSAEKKSGQLSLFPVVEAARARTSDIHIWKGCEHQRDGSYVCPDPNDPNIIRVINKLSSAGSWNETGYDDTFQCQPLPGDHEIQYCLGKKTEFIERLKNPRPPSTEPNTAAVLGSAALSGFASTAFIEGIGDTLRLLNYADESQAENVKLVLGLSLIACSGSWLAPGASMATKYLLKTAGCSPSLANASATAVSCAVSLGVNATPTGLLATAVNLASSKFGFWAEKKVVEHYFDKKPTNKEGKKHSN